MNNKSCKAEAATVQNGQHTIGALNAANALLAGAIGSKPTAKSIAALIDKHSDAPALLAALRELEMNASVAANEVWKSPHWDSLAKSIMQARAAIAQAAGGDK